MRQKLKTDPGVGSVTKLKNIKEELWRGKITLCVGGEGDKHTNNLGGGENRHTNNLRINNSLKTAYIYCIGYVFLLKVFRICMYKVKANLFGRLTFVMYTYFVPNNEESKTISFKNVVFSSLDFEDLLQFYFIE